MQLIHLGRTIITTTYLKEVLNKNQEKKNVKIFIFFRDQFIEFYVKVLSYIKILFTSKFVLKFLKISYYPNERKYYIASIKFRLYFQFKIQKFSIIFIISFSMYISFSPLKGLFLSKKKKRFRILFCAKKRNIAIKKQIPFRNVDLT